ncbi:MAG: hypothetical protein ACQET5_13190 [Halobacteriota archaeon]
MSIDGSIADDVAIAGVGPDTLVEMGDVDDSRNSRCIGIDASGGTIRGLEIRDMRISGNKSVNSNKSSFGLEVHPRGDGHDIYIHDVAAIDSSGKGFAIGGGTVRLERITATGNTRHGVEFRAPSRSWGEWAVHASDVLAENNGGLGIDHNGGSAFIERFWLENNGQGGAKVPWKVKESWWKDGTFVRNRTMGFRFNGDYSNQRYSPMRIHLNNVRAREHPYGGFWLAGDVEYDIDDLVSIENNRNDEQHSNIDVRHKAKLKAGSIYAADAGYGTGMFFASDSQSTISRYQHANNPDGPISGPDQSNVDIKTMESGRPPAQSLPQKDELGAWSNNTSPKSYSATLSLDGGGIHTAGGLIQTR